MTRPFDLRPGWLSPAEAEHLLMVLTATLPWEQKQIRMYGKTHNVPRLTCWLGDAAYTYSGIRNEPRPWTPELADLRDRLAAGTGANYNSVLANLYRDGQDAMGWHADDEAELGSEPTIASVNLGATRDFVVKHKATGDRQVYPLGHGDLMVMAGRSQADWLHSVPKRARITEPRINLTFRWLTTPAVCRLTSRS